VPAQNCARRDKQMPTTSRPQHPDQGADHSAIRPRRPRADNLTPQHGQLMTQHQNLRVLGRLRTRKQRNPRDQPQEDQIHQTQRHGQDRVKPQLPGITTGQRLWPHNWHPQRSSPPILSPARHKIDSPGPHLDFHNSSDTGAMGMGIWTLSNSMAEQQKCLWVKLGEAHVVLQARTPGKQGGGVPPARDAAGRQLLPHPSRA
jgi:hypothetical protein